MAENPETRLERPTTGGSPSSLPEGFLDAEEAQEGFFRSLVEALPVAVYATDAEGRITFYNEAAARLWGRIPRLGEDWWCGSWRLYWPNGERMRHDECPMAITLKTGKPIRGAEAIAERPDGSRFPFIPYPTPIFDSSGRLTGAVNMLVDITERKSAEIATQRLAAIVESSDDVIISKSLEGFIQTWNAAAERMFGYTPEEIIGKSVLALIPPERHHEETDILGRIRNGERIQHFETVRRAKDGRLIDISLSVSPVKNAEGKVVAASKIARDITQQKRDRQKLETLFRVAKEIAHDLDLERIVQSVTDLATAATGAKFGSFFYNINSEAGEAYLLYSLSGADRADFEKLGMPRNTAIFGPTFRGEGVVRSGDIRTDPRYGKSAPHYGMPKGHLPVVSYLAVPVISGNGDVLGGLFFAHSEANVFSKETEELVTAIAALAAAAMDKAHLHRAAQAEIARRQKAEQAQELLLNEIKHRVKNTLGTVQAMASQTFRGAPEEERQAFVARIQALAEAHEGLTRRNWESGDVQEAAQRAMSPFTDGRENRVLISGPNAELPPNKALLISMLLHELGTNAVKYGALSGPSGRVTIDWHIRENGGKPLLEMKWHEAGGPTVVLPAARGFGSKLIERALKAERGWAELTFDPAGVVCRIHVPLN